MTHVHIYIYIYVCVCVCVCESIKMHILQGLSGTFQSKSAQQFG